MPKLSLSTLAMGARQLVVHNEMGYSNKVLELIKHMYSVDHK